MYIKYFYTFRWIYNRCIRVRIYLTVNISDIIHETPHSLPILLSLSLSLSLSEQTSLSPSQTATDGRPSLEPCRRDPRPVCVCVCVLCGYWWEWQRACKRTLSSWCGASMRACAQRKYNNHNYHHHLLLIWCNPRTQARELPHSSTAMYNNDVGKRFFFFIKPLVLPPQTPDLKTSSI